MTPPHTTSPVRLATLLVLSLLGLATLPACARKAPPPTAMNQPVLRVVFDTIPQEERDDIDRFMQARGATKIADMRYELPLAGATAGRAAFTDIAPDVQRWHERISRITNDQDARIPTHDTAVIQLRYISTKALSDSSASITILAYPPGARLFIETPLPGIADRLNEDGSAQLTDGRFTVSLPFSFIRTTDRIYFTTTYRGSTRYFYYDVARQEQIEPPSVTSPTEWDAYKRLRGAR